MNRRQFLKTSGIGLLASAIVPPAALNSCQSSPKNYITEKNQVPIKDSVDVIVCGAGPAGVVAAIEAARTGASTLLIENNGCLGGVWTSGLLSWILDYKNKSGFLVQLIQDLKDRNAVSPIPTGSSLSFDVEEMKLLLEEYCQEAGVRIRLHTRVAGAVKSDGRITHVITESKSGREAWAGKIFIDATGDGDLAALADCGFDYGDPENNATAQPMSLGIEVGGLNFEDIKEYVRWSGDKNMESKKRLLALIEEGGHTLSNKRPSMGPVNETRFILGANHEYGYSPFNADDITKATIHARQEMHSVVRAMRAHGGVWKNARITATAEQIGIREGRRIHGLYTITIRDVIEGCRHEDAVCRVTFPVDVHPVSHANESKELYSKTYKTKPYDIPLRALIAKDVSGLMMAGRCISGEFMAHASYRVTGNAVPMGEAAGKAAAYAALNQCLPQEVPATVYQSSQTNQG